MTEPKTPTEIVKDYCQYFGFTPADLKKNLGNRVRKRVGDVNLSELRQALALLFRRHYGLTLNETRKAIGWHDHTTAHYAAKMGLQKYQMNDRVFMRYWDALMDCVFIGEKPSFYPLVVGKINEGLRVA
jgi:chromosomal replication initiation ATPase DnaA